MLYDPAPLNDPGDPGHDMSPWVNYSAGLQSFNYRRKMQSATEADWRNRMVFFTGDERAFYPDESTKACEPTEAITDPSCRTHIIRTTTIIERRLNPARIYVGTSRRTHKEVAYKGYGTYREGCTFESTWNAWKCSGEHLTPARLIIESMDEDHLSRSLTPVALASGGYVDLMNAGWDHQRPKVVTRST